MHLPFNKYKKNIVVNNKKKIKMKQRKDGNGGVKKWYKHSNKKCRANNPKCNSKAKRRKMEILRLTMGFNLLTKSGCASIKNVVGLIPHIPLSSMIHGPPV